MTSNDDRFLIVSHGHPSVSTGGAELAAYALFEQFRQRDGYHALLLARVGPPNLSHPGSPFSSACPDGSEVLLNCTFEGMHLFFQTQPDLRVVWMNVRDLLDRFQPTVVHFHHYLHLGVEMIRAVRNFRPDIPIVMTLHEFVGICFHDGQMVTTTGNKLCSASSPAKCHRCFPQHHPNDFLIRELYIKSFFELVDHFISPSEFLKQRYVEWGLPADKITVIENGQAAPTRISPHRVLGNGQRRSRFGFFGQVSPYKGLHVLLAAIDLLPSKIRREVFVEVHGANLELQSSTYCEEVNRLHEIVKDRVQFFGRYEHSDLPDIMANIDWVVLPSVWWENSPLVIQEAFLHRRPVICSNIGGMAEKVENEKTGIHFRVGSPSALALAIERAVVQDGLWEKFVGAIQPPPSIAATSKLNLEVYRSARSDLRSAKVLG